MRLGWRIPLPGPFYLGGTIWQSHRRPAEYWTANGPDGWKCPHHHRREDTAVECSRRYRRSLARKFPS